MLRNDDECGVVTLERGWKIALLAFRVRHAEQGDVEDGLQFPKHPLTQIELHPFDTVAWITAPIDIKDESGKVIFADNVEFPDTWGERDKQVVASKYFFGDHGQGFRETSLKQMVARVSYSIGLWALDNGTFRSPADAENFLNYLMMIQIHQEFAFNSPVYFNVGVHCYGLEPSPENYIWDEESQGVIPCPDANKYPQISACFIQSVEDNMQSIMKLATSEAMLFKRGSGTGTDLSTLRSSKERLSCGGTASGPVSFMAVFDRIAAIVKSGGRTRRAAKMQTIKYWHPDIWEFVECKPRMERMARTLIRNGYEANFNGEVYSTVLFQNANLSVRVDDYFMSAARDGGTFDTRAVTTGDIVATYPAEKLLDAIAFGSHDCGDPALQFEDTIQRWHTVPNHGPINSSNPCARRGSRLLTAGGWMKVEDLSELESVDIFDGVGFVSGKVWLTGRKGLVRLHMNSGETLDLTPDHRVYTTEGWKSAESCVDSVVPRVLPNIPSTGDTQLPRAITGASGKFYSACDVLLMEALGFLQGDGSLREGIATLHYTPEKDLEYIESSIVPVLSDIAADKGETHYYPHSDGHKFVFSRRRLTEWLQAIGFVFRPLPERILPGLIWGAKRNAQAAFLRGLFGANGNVLRDARNAIVLVSTCRQMLSEVQLILRTLGIMSSVRIHSKAQDVEWDNGVYVSKESYHLEITHQQDISVFARQVGFPQSSQQSKLMEAVRMERADSRDGGPSKRAFMKVVKVENISEEDDVYDFRTPTTAMGLCNGVIIHNCSEYMHIDDSACNLASVNLLRFYGASGRARPGWNRDHLFNTCRVAATSMETMVGRASYPTPEIALNSHRFRPLGGGYCNLGALVMVRGLPYDSPGARLLGAALASLITGAFYLTSADLARRFGAFDGYAVNADAMIRVIDMHRQNFMDQRKEYDTAHGITVDDRELFDFIDRLWIAALSEGRSCGYRNSQATCIAPTGCAVPDTLVLTDRGLARLGTLGDRSGPQWQDTAFRVQTDSGPQDVTQFFINGTKPVVRAVTTRGYRFRATPDHRVKVVDRDGSWVWRRMDELDEGDIVPIKLGGMHGHVVSIPLPKFPVLDARATCVVAPAAMNRDLAELVGAFMANGSLHEKGIRISVFKHDSDLINRTVGLFAEVFGLRADVSPDSEHVVAVVVNSIPLTRWWGEAGFVKRVPRAGYVGKGFVSHVPDSILATNDPLIYAAFLRGVIDHDGTVSGGCPEIMNSSRDFMADIQVMALALGFPLTMREGRSEWGDRPIWRARLLNRDYVVSWREWIGFTESRKDGALRATESRAGMGDVIVLPRKLIDRICPINHPSRRTALMSFSRSRGITRRLASRLYQETKDSELSNYIGFVYDKIFESVMEDHPSETYDLSVPSNVTWIGGGFVSHNTIGFMMGCDTLSIEPETALVRYKHLAGGGVLKLVNTCIKESLCGLGYDNYGIEHVTKHMETFGTIEDITWDGPEPRLNQASGLKREHLPVFDCAFPPAPGEVDGRKFRPREGRSIAPAGHVRMMGQATGCVSGAISKTVNMPASSTVEDIKKIYFDAWQSGCKSISVYRDGSKGDQPVSTSAPVGSRPIPASAPATPARFRMPDDRPATIHKFNIMGHEGFITVGFTADGQPGEVFISVAKQGSTVGGLMGVIGTLISLLLQHYVPMSKVVEKLSGQNFEPRGITKNINIRFCKSIVDYLGQYLGSHFVPGFQAGKNPLRADGATSAASSGPDALEESLPIPLAGYAANLNGSICPSCGEIMVRVNVNCEVCSCGHSEGGCGG